MKGYENQEAFTAPLSNGGALFVFRHSSILFPSGPPHRLSEYASPSSVLPLCLLRSASRYQGVYQLSFCVLLCIHILQDFRLYLPSLCSAGIKPIVPDKVFVPRWNVHCKFCNKVARLDELYIFFPVVIVLCVVEYVCFFFYTHNFLEKDRMPYNILAEIHPCFPA